MRKALDVGVGKYIFRFFFCFVKSILLKLSSGNCVEYVKV